MMSAQLFRVILGASASGTEDEMRAAPDGEGGYGGADDLLEEIATRIGSEPRAGGDRRPGGQSPAT